MAFWNNAYPTVYPVRHTGIHISNGLKEPFEVTGQIRSISFKLFFSLYKRIMFRFGSLLESQSVSQSLLHTHTHPNAVGTFGEIGRVESQVRLLSKFHTHQRNGSTPVSPTTCCQYCKMILPISGFLWVKLFCQIPSKVPSRILETDNHTTPSL